MEQLRTVYPNIMQLVLEKHIRKEEGMLYTSAKKAKRTTKELFEEFYELVTDEKLSDSQMEMVNSMIEEIGGGLQLICSLWQELLSIRKTTIPDRFFTEPSAMPHFISGTEYSPPSSPSYMAGSLTGEACFWYVPSVILFGVIW